MTKAPSVLLVEDDLRLAELVRTYLHSNNFQVGVEHRGDRVLERVQRESPDLVILDIGLPGQDGFAVCKSLRTTSNIPVLILTARDNDIDHVVGLELGADDYVVKPVEPRVLIARIQALLRRTRGPTSMELKSLRFGSLSINPVARSVTLLDKSITLSSNEFDLLYFLAARADEIQSRETLYLQLYKREYDGLDRSLDVRVSHLRKKLGDEGSPDKIPHSLGPRLPVRIGRLVMARHFLQLYLLIVVTLVATSWGQEQITRTSTRDAAAAALENPVQIAVMNLVADRLRGVEEARLDTELAALARRTQTDLELFELHDIAGAHTLMRLRAGERTFMERANGQSWLLERLGNSEHVVAFKYATLVQQRSVLDWALSLAFYAAIAFVLMLWLWPLTRDLRELERATMTFGNRNWKFDTQINARSQVSPLAQAFRRMAARIDGLIASHKDMSNALSHEIKTPLARMRFEIEMARAATDKSQLNEHLDHINTDVTELNAFVTATLDYAILERAEVALNLAEHDFTLVLPALVESAQRGTRPELAIACDITTGATRVRCDAHLIETVLRNLLYNAIRHATRRVRVSFRVDRDAYTLQVDDDGPGIPLADRERVFESFVQLDGPGAKSGFGLGLAIVKRIVEWHGGTVSVTHSDLGGARFAVVWRPAS